MARTTSTRSNKIDPTRPFFAAVGTVDIAVAAARNGLTEAQTRLAKVEFEPKALAGQSRSAVTSRVDDLQKEAKAIPGRAQKLVNDYVADLGETVEDVNKQYVELAQRGRTLVNRIRGQQATQELKSSARTTKSTAKRTSTQTRKTAGAAKRTARTATSSAKATGTSARKTATAAKKATKSAAAKTGA
jgi:heparin binding hemagglutinin HbhA